MVGEIRDAETAQIAIQSALTGHLVFTTVHANNVFDVIGRFVNMGIEPYNFVSALNCVLAQDEKKGLTFARGLRSILRHDPDKIMVGEIRDAETAQIAIQSALTGHLVFTTVHANNVFDVIGRFVNMGIEPYNFVSALNCVLAQRLVRLSCLSCREQIPLDKTMAEESGLDYQRIRDIPLYQGRGCRECLGTGFRGRECITEFLEFTEDIKEMVLSRQPTSDIKARALAAGMITLRQAAIRKVLRGVTTLREINRVSSVERTF